MSKRGLIIVLSISAICAAILTLLSASGINMAWAWGISWSVFILLWVAVYFWQRDKSSL